jgi:hypothetical protein
MVTQARTGSSVSLFRTHAHAHTWTRTRTCMHAHSSMHVSCTRIHTCIPFSIRRTHARTHTHTCTAPYIYVPVALTHTQTQAYCRLSNTQARAHTHFLCRSTIHTHLHARVDCIYHPHTHRDVRGAGEVRPRTSAHVPDCSQVGALPKHGPHMLGTLVANLVVVQAGVRPPTQSVTHTDTDKEKEATQGPTHKDE